MTRIPRIWIADFDERPAYAAPLLALQGFEWVTDSARPEVTPPDLDLVVVTDERTLPWIVPTLRSCRAQGIPSLHVVDGITDWRNCFDNPTFDLPGAPSPTLFTPVVADKIACLGVMQCLLLEHFGNRGKPENAGSLRLDAFARSLPPVTAPNTPRRVLVTTARTPAFTTAQHDALVRLLATLRDTLSSPALPPCEITWRLPARLASDLRLPSTQTNAAGEEFQAALLRCDVLVTTSSTTLLEGMLAGKPTVLLEHTNTPAYMGAAWSLRPGSDLAAVLLGALDPPQHRIQHQRLVLDLNLQQGDAEDRHRKLIETLIAAGRAARERGGPLTLPSRILPAGFLGADDAPAAPRADHTASLAVENAQLRRQHVLHRQHIQRLENELAVPLKKRLWQRLAGRLGI
jgi:hypothetical protein